MRERGVGMHALHLGRRQWHDLRLFWLATELLYRAILDVREQRLDMQDRLELYSAANLYKHIQLIWLGRLFRLTFNMRRRHIQHVRKWGMDMQIQHCVYNRRWENN